MLVRRTFCKVYEKAYWNNCLKLLKSSQSKIMECLENSAPLSSICKQDITPVTNHPGTTIISNVDFPVNWNDKKKDECVKTFEKALQLYKADEIMLAFNGGKDCTVLLDLLTKFYNGYACIKHLSIPVLYIQAKDAFEEVDEFVEYCTKFYNIDMHMRSGDVKNALSDFCKEMPQIKAVFMGSRRTDPFCEHLSEIQASDPDWPKLMRINPILDWTYRDIWNYIFKFKVSYCSLYDEGYTSLGGKTNTIQNPHLKELEPDSCIASYRPAYELKDEDGTLERAGRFHKLKNIDSTLIETETGPDCVQK